MTIQGLDQYSVGTPYSFPESDLPYLILIAAEVKMSGLLSLPLFTSSSKQEVNGLVVVFMDRTLAGKRSFKNSSVSCFCNNPKYVFILCF